MLIFALSKILQEHLHAGRRATEYTPLCIQSNGTGKIGTTVIDGGLLARDLRGERAEDDIPIEIVKDTNLPVRVEVVVARHILEGLQIGMSYSRGSHLN